jgi:uncharacterized membrane protein YeaQ/YmgE (transglycosylase-associated protein family)
MAIAYVIGWIVLAGLVGGLLNGYFASEGLVLPRRERLSDGQTILRPGFIGNVIVGAVTAVVLTSLYSPIGALKIGTASAQTYDLTVGAVVGAFLNGLGGARLLTQEVNRRYDDLAKRRMSTVITESLETSRPGDQ